MIEYTEVKSCIWRKKLDSDADIAAQFMLFNNDLMMHEKYVSKEQREHKLVRKVKVNTDRKSVQKEHRTHPKGSMLDAQANEIMEMVGRTTEYICSTFFWIYCCRRSFIMLKL